MSAARQYGFTAAELASLTLADLRPPEEVERLRAAMAGHPTGSGFVGTFKHWRKDHALMDVNVHVDEVNLGGRKLRLAVLHDVTEQTVLEGQFRQAQKMEAVGRLAGGVAHDFNNLLTVINGYGSVLLDETTPDSPEREPLSEIVRAGERAATLTRQLLAFSRKQVLKPQILDLNAVMRDTEKMLRRMIGEDVDLLTILSPRLDFVTVDPGQVEQVVMNLAVNARDAMPKGGRLTIETRNVTVDETLARQTLSISPGRYVALIVADSGCGIGPETRSHLFEPFFTTKEQGKGTGLGLATVFGIVKQSGGGIAVKSDVGKGATFEIYLPAAKDVPASAGRTLSESLDLGGAETILLVEDDVGVRGLAQATLDERGYNVLVAENAGKAMEAAARFEGPIHLLLTDVVMPGPSGPALAESLKASRPDMKVLFVSGYSDDAVTSHGILGAGAMFLEKPFTPRVLALKVRQVLGAAAPSLALRA